MTMGVAFESDCSAARRPARVMLLCALMLKCGGCLSAVYATGNHDANARWANQLQARVVVSGIVVDESNQPLSDVTVYATAVTLSPGSEGSSDVSEKEASRSYLVNWRFNLDIKKAWRVMVTISKPGHQSVDLQYDTAPGIDPHHDLYRTPARAQDIVADRQTIVLKRLQ